MDFLCASLMAFMFNKGTSNATLNLNLVESEFNEFACCKDF